jgi:primosomal protein N' (replication factor Y)
MEAKCPTCGTQLAMLGMGTQRVEEELTRLIPAIRLARVDSDTMRSGKDYESILSRFGTGDIQVLLGTQMIAKGLDFPNVTLVGVISADTSLALPDFRSAERTFQLITQVAGRAGRAEAPGRVVVQTFLPDDATIRSALTHDYNGFAARELDLRKSVSYPPFARLARIILRDTDEEKLKTAAETLATGLATAAESADGADRLTVKGPSPCPINKIAGHHRIQVLLSAPTASPIQSTLAAARESGLFKNTDRIAVDIDPVSLL